MLQPQYFDILGMLAFAYIVIVGFWSLKSIGRVPQWAYILLFVVGLLGFIVDGVIVYQYFLKN